MTPKELEDILNDNSMVFIDFWGEWCPHCIAIMPTIDSLSKTYKDKIRVVKIDASNSMDIVLKYNITSFPSFLVFKNKELIQQINGGTTPRNLKDIFKNLSS